MEIVLSRSGSVNTTRILLAMSGSMEAANLRLEPALYLGLRWGRLLLPIAALVLPHHHCTARRRSMGFLRSERRQ